MENFLSCCFDLFLKENILTTARKYQLGIKTLFDLANVNNYSF